MSNRIKVWLAAMRMQLVGWLPKQWRSVFLYPPGHFYSPLVDLRTVKSSAKRIAGDDESGWESVDLDVMGQQEAYKVLLEQSRHLKFPDHATEGFRYYASNDMFGYGDAFVLSAILQQAKPRRVVEVGSGFSSAVMLDTADACDIETHFTFVEIRPQRLRSLFRGDDTMRASIEERPVQEVDKRLFSTLEAGDILFVDSSHVAKVGSDVSHLLLKVLPCLNPGVLVHIHDIFYPESYPTDWLLQGRSWNESLFVRAFLAQNHCYRVRAFNAFAAKTFPELFSKRLPRFLDDPGGSLWLERSN